MPSNIIEETACKSFNDAHAIGTLVDYWRGAKEGEPSGRGATYTEAQMMGGHTAVVWIEGCRGAISLSHVEVVNG